ncbi:MAG TPA: hypothetical protein VNT60_06425 [Deinococcales bacterium]|nr:hypothetical protein [Deinococcales bacterium]
MARLDGKFEVVRELSSREGRTSYEALTPDGQPARVDWFEVGDPKTRADYHRYRSALKATASPLLLDAVARPGAYYSAWQPSSAPEAQAWLTGRATASSRSGEAVALRALR